MTSNLAPTARIRIRLATGELEIEGTESFVSRYAESIDAIVDRLHTGSVITQPASTATPAGGVAAAESVTSPSPDEPFGEVLHTLASKSGTDQILLSGYYVTKGTPDGTFSTADANSLLIEQGVKLSNASQSMKNNLNAKRVFKVGSRFKVAKTGVDHLKTLGVPAS